MNTLQKNKKSNKKIIIAAIILSMAVIAAFFAVMFGFGLITPPNFLAGIFGANPNESILPGDDGKIYDAIKNGTKYDTISITYDLTSEDKYDILNRTKEAEVYTFFCNTLNRDGDTELSRQHKIWREHDKYRIESYEKGKLVRRIICDGRDIEINSYIEGNLVSSNLYGLTDEFSIADQAGTVALSDFISNPYEESFAASIIRTESSSLWYAELIRSDIPQKENIYLSLEFGITVNCEVFYDGELTYKLTTDLISPEIEGFDGNVENIFSIS